MNLVVLLRLILDVSLSGGMFASSPAPPTFHSTLLLKRLNGEKFLFYLIPKCRLKTGTEGPDFWSSEEHFSVPVNLWNWWLQVHACLSLDMFLQLPWRIWSCKFPNLKKNPELKHCIQNWGAWVAHLGKHPTSAQVMISWFMSLSSASGSRLSAQSLLQILCLLLCLPLSRLFSLSLKINK